MTGEKLRFDRLLANLGYGSRKDVQRLIDGGYVMLDGQIIDEAKTHVQVTPDLSERLTIDGEPCDPMPGLTVMLHKPLGVTCSHKEVGELVYDLFPPRWSERKPMLSTIGRLDKDTSGLLLLTDDGALLHRVISPKNNIPKRYCVTLAEALRGDEAQLFAAGTLMLDGETTPLAPAVLDVTGTHTAMLTITEGRYHQVRRMFAATGNHVVQLHRDLIGTLELPPELASGQFRSLTPEEITKLFVQ